MSAALEIVSRVALQLLLRTRVAILFDAMVPVVSG